jgi:hypothetical protein
MQKKYFGADFVLSMLDQITLFSIWFEVFINFIALSLSNSILTDKFRESLSRKVVYETIV